MSLLIIAVIQSARLYVLVLLIVEAPKHSLEVFEARVDQSKVLIANQIIHLLSYSLWFCADGRGWRVVRETLRRRQLRTTEMVVTEHVSFRRTVMNRLGRLRLYAVGRLGSSLSSENARRPALTFQAKNALLGRPSPWRRQWSSQIRTD